VLNEYMKKHSNKMKDEFETLSRLHKKTHDLVSKVEDVADECSSCLRVIQTGQETKHLIEVDHALISTLSKENKE
jgi:hypothetical protein